jgi:hypothetical protein
MGTVDLVTVEMGENMLSILPYSGATCASFLAVPHRFIGLSVVFGSSK